MVCWRVLISGRVQGVGYRYSTRENAIALGVVGWVRNLPNGQVEALLEGESEQVNSLVKWCHSGPPAAKVTAVETHVETQAQALERFETFEIRR